MLDLLHDLSENLCIILRWIAVGSEAKIQLLIEVGAYFLIV